MIEKIRDFSKRRRLKKAFSKMVSPSAVEKILKSKSDFEGGGKLNEKTLGVVLVLLRYSTHSEMAKHISLVASLAREHGAGNEAMTNCLLVFCYGRFADERNPEEKRRNFVQAIQTKLGNAVRIVHGTGVGHLGLVGSTEMAAYTFLTPKFDEALGILCHLKHGETREVAFS